MHSKIIMFHNISEICLFIHIAQNSHWEYWIHHADQRTILPVLWTSNGFTILALGGERGVGDGVIVSFQF